MFFTPSVVSSRNARKSTQCAAKPVRWEEAWSRRVVKLDVEGLQENGRVVDEDYARLGLAAVEGNVEGGQGRLTGKRVRRAAQHHGEGRLRRGEWRSGEGEGEGEERREGKIEVPSPPLLPARRANAKFLRPPPSVGPLPICVRLRRRRPR